MPAKSLLPVQVDSTTTTEQISVFATATTYDAFSDTLSAEGNEVVRVWQDLFERSGHKMTKLHVFSNIEMTKRFEDARARLDELGRPTDEVQLFHGTREANFESILRDGLHVGGTRGIEIGIGCASGVGIYLVESAASAVGYTHGANKIFGCRVLPGNVTDNVDKVRKIPNVDLGVGAEKFDSYKGPYGKEVLYVVRHSDLVLPCYMIEFMPRPPAEKSIKTHAPVHQVTRTSVVKAIQKPARRTRAPPSEKKAILDPRSRPPPAVEVSMKSRALRIKAREEPSQTNGLAPVTKVKRGVVTRSRAKAAV